MLVRSKDPIPKTITMSSKTPGIIQRTLIGSSATKNYHHTVSRACRAKGSGVIDSNSRLFRSIYALLLPLIRTFFEIKNPNIIHLLKFIKLNFQLINAYIFFLLISNFYLFILYALSNYPTFLWCWLMLIYIIFLLNNTFSY